MTASHQTNLADGGQPSHHEALLERVVDQLAGQLPSGPALPVLIPTVAFGGQNRSVLPRTIVELSRQRASCPITVVLLANRPRARAADDTVAQAAATISALRCPEVSFAVAEVVLPTRVRVGELRQLAFDASVAVQRLDPELTGFVIADDDLVHVPPGLLEGLHAAIVGPQRADAVLGPVLFDSPQLPAPMLPEFFLADALRALLAARLVRCQAADPSDACRAEGFRRHAESIVLSGNLAVRGSALGRTGGFAPYNEITQLVRGVHALRGADGHTGTSRVVGSWDFDARAGNVLGELYRTALRISGRRALAAYAAAAAPTVAQWRTCRFRASRVDPVRLGEPLVLEATPVARLRPHEMRTLTDRLETALGTTLAHFPPDPAVSGECLAALGLPPAAITVTSDLDSGDVAIRIRDVSGALERLRALQETLPEERDADVG